MALFPSTIPVLHDLLLGMTPLFVYRGLVGASR
jgi:hypothetical protein